MIEVSREQLRRYADVICDWQAGLSNPEIAKLRDLPGSLVAVWIENFCCLDIGFAR